MRVRWVDWDPILFHALALHGGGIEKKESILHSFITMKRISIITVGGNIIFIYTIIYSTVISALI